MVAYHVISCALDLATTIFSKMATHHARASSYQGKSFHSALGYIPLGNVDLETLERLEHSPELDHYLDPAAPGILYTLVQTYIKRKRGRFVRKSLFSRSKLTSYSYLADL